MLTGLDHIAIGVSDLDEAVKKYTQLGFTVVAGGRHPAGSHNALIALADGSYIELIAFFEPNPEHPWWPKVQRGGGLIDFCAGTDDLEGDMDNFRRAGIKMSDPTSGSRLRPDGFLVKWLLSMPGNSDRGVVPFLIQDKTLREERVPKETKHQNQVTGIGTLTIAVDDLPTIRRWYSGILKENGQEIERDDLHAAGARFTIGEHYFDLIAPMDSESPLNDWLGVRGPSPYAVTLKTVGGNSGLTDETKSLGPQLVIV